MLLLTPPLCCCRYVIRAYVSSGVSLFGESETSITSRMPVASLQAKLPRIARVNDTFTAGATVTMTDDAFRGPVKVVLASLQEQGVYAHCAFVESVCFLCRLLPCVVSSVLPFRAAARAL